MKTSFPLIVAVAALLVASCRPPQPTSESTAESTAETKEPTKSTPVDTPAPIPPPTEKHLAPEGTYFVMRQVSLTTDSGNIDVPAGTQVRLISKEGDSLRVTDGKNEFSIPALQLTQDLDVAAAVVAARVAASTAAISSAATAELTQSKAEVVKAEPAPEKKPEAQAVLKPLPKNTPRPEPTAVASKKSTPPKKSSRAQELETRYKALEQEENSVGAQLAGAERARQQAERDKWRYRNPPGRTVSKADIKALKVRLKQIQQDKQQVGLQLGSQPQ